MIFFDTTRTGRAGHRSGLNRVSQRLRETLGDRAIAAAWSKSARAFRAENRSPGAGDWLLTTELFKRQSANAKLGRAQAMREASLAVMGQTAKPERGSPYSYAHPMFWAPFVVVGDGG